MANQAYLVDGFEQHAASAAAAGNLLRSLGGALLPLVGGPMFSALGVGWECSVLALVAVMPIPMPMLFFKYGGRLRRKQFFDVKY